ncbi:FAD:protein FMN transferase [Clavibacter michiganensis]|uniref:FAD:protein FMN transferase n=2 Tax=Clavibacter michiganensis TaxID=28447 RepID=UPI003EBEA4A6
MSGRAGRTVVRAFDVMGTTVSVRAAPDAPIAAVQAVFADADALFSLYRSDSEASRIARGELALTASSPRMRDAYADALGWRAATDGAFTPHRPDGVVDLSGTVKAHAMAEAADLLGDGDWLLAVGGDVLGSGTDDAGGAWRIGVVDPADRRALLCALPLAGGRHAVATSGTAERGEHVWRRPPMPGEAAFAQVTVVADDIVTADVLATAILAGGRAGLDAAVARFDMDAITVDVDGALLVTDRIRPLIS